MEETKRFISSK